MVGTRIIDLNPPSPARAKKPVQEVYMHHCAMCGGDWVGIDADPEALQLLSTRRAGAPARPSGTSAASTTRR